MGMRNSELKNIISQIRDNIFSKGFQRYDPTDIMSHSSILDLQSRLPRIIWIGFKVVEIMFPKILRRLLNVNKSVAPTTFWHLIESEIYYLKNAKNKDQEYLNKLCQEVVKIGVGQPICWEHPYKSHGFAWKDSSFLKNKQGYNCCAHNSARLALALFHSGNFTKDEKLKKIALSASYSLIANHNWHYSKNKTATISYYSNTNDEVINTAADVALLFAEAYKFSNDDVFKIKLEMLINMILQEQTNGSWRYCTSAHEEKFGPSHGADNHHTAMIIRALASLCYNYNFLSSKKKSMIESIILSVNFYMDKLTDIHGICYLLADRKTEANIAGYCEGILALQIVEKILMDDHKTLAYMVSLRRRSMINTVCKRFYVKSDGSVVSSKRLGINYSIDSIRWGNGLLLEALTNELNFK
jgi:hypothetical protein